MKFGILGTGVVGQTMAGKLAQMGHSVVMGTRDPAATLARNDPGPYGLPPFTVWHRENPAVKVATMAEAASHGEMVINATNGVGALAAVESAGEKNLSGKVLIDISNPLDFSRGMPPSLTVCNLDSLGEQIQKKVPGARVVKTLNIVNAWVMVAPAQVPGETSMFVAGNDAGAKKDVTAFLATLGWKDIIDVGDITSSRALEMYLPLWVRLLGALNKPMFNIKVVR